MYGLVLMSSLATGGDVPSFGWGAGCSGGSCTGVVVSSCSGCGGCTGYAPAGCCGGYVSTGCGGCGGRGLFPLFPGLRSRLSGVLGGGRVGGSCYGSSCYGASSCYGSSCLGSYSTGCTGSACYGSSCFGSSCLGTGCFGSGPVHSGPIYYGADFHPTPVVTGGVILGSNSVAPSYPQVAIPTAPVVADVEVARAKPDAAPARLTLDLPADATLYVDGDEVKGSGVSRNFHTPDLPVSGTYFYDLKAVVMVDGKPVSETLRVTVKGGQSKSESFGKLIAAVKAANPSAYVAK